MLSIILICLGCLYMIGAVLAYGIEFAFWQRSYPYVAKEDYCEDRIGAVVIGLFWPIVSFGDYYFNWTNFISKFKTTGIKFK